MVLSSKTSFINFSLSVAKLKISKRGQDCSIIFCEDTKYILKLSTGPSLVGQSIDLFNDLTKFVKELNSEIKSNIKFRTKGNFSYDSKQRFSNIFGENAISLTSFKNPFEKTIFNSKLLILTYQYVDYVNYMIDKKCIVNAIFHENIMLCII